ncbi:CBS domain-containing protein [Sphingomonas sp. ID0503]|uniref:CBS domain-containing protein n=1 Tax=Sphingomonas sp. ID0503 TaxID=3399691 RepID=UPI003AFA471C
MTIASVLARKGSDVFTVEQSERVEAAVALLADRRVGALPVMDGGRIAGIFSERDLLYGIRKEGPAFVSRRLSEAMTTPAVTARPDTGVIEALATMTRRRIRHLPVVDSSGALVGVVSIGDLVKFRIDGMEAETRAMRDYITTA